MGRLAATSVLFLISSISFISPLVNGQDVQPGRTYTSLLHPVHGKLASFTSTDDGKHHHVKISGTQCRFPYTTTISDQEYSTVLTITPDAACISKTKHWIPVKHAVSTSGNYSNAGLDIGNVSPTEKSQWCESQFNTCPLLCGGEKFTETNSCDATALTTICTCQNGVPNMDSYEGTLAFFICQAEFGQCIVEHPNSAIGQAGCKKTFACGKLQASDVPSGAGALAASTSSTTTSTATLEISKPSTTSLPASALTLTANNGASTATASPSQKSAASVVIAYGAKVTAVLIGGMLVIAAIVW